MFSSKNIHEGYVMIDHRASPGMTPDEARLMGYEPEHVSEGKLFETKTNHCCHCGTVVIMNPLRTRERSFCSSCSKYVCDNCGIEMRLSDYIHSTYQDKLNNRLTELANLKGI
jgi:hypothetical protein